MWLPIVGASVSWGSPFTHICKCVFADIQGASTCACNVTSLHPTHTTDGSVTCSQSLAAEMNILHYPVGDKVFSKRVRCIIHDLLFIFNQTWALQTKSCSSALIIQILACILLKALNMFDKDSSINEGHWRKPVIPPWWLIRKKNNN